MSRYSPELHLISDEDVVKRVHAGEQVGDAQHDEHVPLVEAEGPELRQRRLQWVAGVVRSELGGSAAAAAACRGALLRRTGASTMSRQLASRTGGGLAASRLERGRVVTDNTRDTRYLRSRRSLVCSRPFGDADHLRLYWMATSTSDDNVIR